MSVNPDNPQPDSSDPVSDPAPEIEMPAAAVEDPIGDVTDGEARISIAVETGAESEAESESAEEEPETGLKPRSPANLERLQKILAQAGVASRRKAEEMIEQGRIQVNGKTVTALGTKADAGRDHIRVDGKLLQGAERLRYFVLNKPRGFVTTVRDPEGRPTVMQFFEKMRERLYPVGRLDYMSEGLLLVTNDGELANRLTRAASGVEKTYLVKVAGQPTESELEVLRGGVAIERGKPGSAQVRTSPARIRQVRQGDNPWYEVVLIEGRNRELRKMFEEIGHFVEKIRRVGYGPLVLDQEPGNLRELEPKELELLRKAADGTLRTPKAKELRRRNALDAQLPTLAPRPSRPRPASPAGEGVRPAAGRPPARNFDRAPARPDDRPRRAAGEGPARFGPARPARQADREDRAGARPAWKKDDRGTRPAGRPAARFPSGSSGEARPGAERRHSGPVGAGRTGGERPLGGRPAGKRPAWNKSAGNDRPAYKRPAPPRHESRVPDEDPGPVRPPNLHIEEIHPSDRPAAGRPSAPRPYKGRPGPIRSGSARPSSARSSSAGPRSDRAASERPGAGRPFRGEGGLARPFTTSSGKPRAGGARPSSKPGKPAGRSYGVGPAKRPFEGRPGGPARGAYRGNEAEGSSAPRDERRTGWKPKPSFGGPPKPGSAARSKPKPGSSAKSGYKGKPSGSGPKRAGPKRAGPGSFGKSSGGAPGGKRRG